MLRMSARFCLGSCKKAHWQSKSTEEGDGTSCITCVLLFSLPEFLKSGVIADENNNFDGAGRHFEAKGD